MNLGEKKTRFMYYIQAKIPKDLTLLKICHLLKLPIFFQEICSFLPHPFSVLFSTDSVAYSR